MRITLKNIIIFFSPLLFFHILATVNHWYWIYHWLDIPMHLLGGFGLAMIFFWLNPEIKINNEKLGSFNNATLQIFSLLCFIALIAVFWEFFEFLLFWFLGKTQLIENKIIQDSFNLYQDTLGDLLNGLSGGLIFSFLNLARKRLLN